METWVAGGGEGRGTGLFTYTGMKSMEHIAHIFVYMFSILEHTANFGGDKIWVSVEVKGSS